MASALGRRAGSVAALVATLVAGWALAPAAMGGPGSLLSTRRARARPVAIGTYQELPFGVSRSHPNVTDGVRDTRDGRSTARIPARQPSVRFTARIGASDAAGPLALNSGVVLASASNRATYVAASGELAPEAATLHGAAGVSLAPGGGYVVAENDGLLWLDHALAVLARVPVASLSPSAPLVLEDGSAVVTAGARLLRIDAQGNEVFSLPVASRTASPVARTPSGALVAATTSELLLVSEAGRLLHRETFGELPVAGPAVALDGTIWMLTRLAVVAFDPEGRVRRSVRAPTSSVLTHGSLAIAADGGVRVAALGVGLFALNASGETLWTFELPLARFTLVDADGASLVVAHDGAMVAVDASGAERWRVSLGGAPHAAPVLGRDGTVFVGLRGGELLGLR